MTQPVVSLPETVSDSAVKLVASIDDTDVELLDLAGGFARDVATGRLMLGGVELGDTGLRHISTLFVNGWSASTCTVQRNGSFVTLSMQMNGTQAAAGTDAVMFTLPVGFRPSVNLLQRPLRNGATVVLSVRSTGNVERTLSGDAIYLQEIWQTNDAWPTSLPGVAA